MRRMIPIIVLVTAVAVVAGQLTGRDVLEKAIKRYRGDDSVLTVILTKVKMENPTKKKRFLITTYSKSRPEIVKALVAVRRAGSPESKPILFLVWDWQDTKRNDQLWFCLPSIGKYNRISAEKGESMTEKYGFSIEEMKTRDLDLADHTLEGTVEIGGEKVYKVVSIPKRPKKEGFSKLEVFIRPGNWTLAKAKYIDLDGKKLKVFRVTRIEKVDGIWSEMAGEHKDYEKRTIVTFNVKKIEYNKKLSSSLFNFTKPPKHILEGN